MFQNDNPANQSHVEKFLENPGVNPRTHHQDATLDKNDWVPDNKVNKCTKCKKNFTFLYRKHHCRICGNVFCNNCTIVKNVFNKGSVQKDVRMCDICEKDLENYNRSLMIKNNLLKADHNRMSQMQSDSSLLQENQNPRSGAPRNDNRNDSDEESKAYGSAFHNRVGEPLTVAELRQQEEIKRRVTILEGAEKGDVNEYLKDVNEEEKTERTFSDARSIAPSMMKEVSVKQRLRDYSVHHIKNIVFDLMKQYSIDQKKWENKLLQFVQNAVDNVRPSSRVLNDSMNFNSFIKIKIINWEDNSRSQYVNGVVMSKNIADKRMKSRIENPSILLLKESVGTMRSEGALTDIQSLVDQEDYWIQIIKQKLTQVKPTIIIVEKEMGYKILDVLREADITVITDLSHHQMKRIQRYTQTIIAPSYNVIDKSFVLGKCKAFKVEAPYQGSQMQRMNQMDQYQKQDASQNFISKNRSLVIFEGTNPALGCTILISGNMLEEIDELKKVKQALREMLKLARNIVLERAFLLQLNCNIPKPVYYEDGSLNVSESPFLVTRNIPNRQTFVVSKVIMKKGIAGLNLTPSNPILTTNANLNVSQHINTGGFVNNDESALNQHLTDTVTPNMHAMSRAAPDAGKVNENYVKTKIDSMCGCPKKEKMTFYQKDQDETVGKFLYSLSKMLINNCEQCKEPLIKHLIQYYHKEGCLEIQLELKQINSNMGQTGTSGGAQGQPGQRLASGQGGQGERKSRDIIMRGECQICKKQVTADTVMSNTLFEYSRARFLEQFFYNGDKLVNTSVGCSHRSLKDINRIFIMPSGFQITFTYIPQDVYQIEMIQPKKQDTSSIFKQEIEQRKARMIEFSSQAYLDIKTRLQKLIDFMRSEKRSYISKDMQKKLEYQNISLFTTPLKRIKERLSPLDPSKQQQRDDSTGGKNFRSNTFEDDLTHMLNEIQKPIQEVKNIFEAMFLERKIIINFLTYSRLLEETARIVCLLLGLLRLRMIVISKSDSSTNTSANSYEAGSMTADHRSESNMMFKNLVERQGGSQTPQLMRRPSHLADHQSSEQMSKDSAQMHPAFSFIDDFITQNDMKQIQNNMLSTPGVGAQPNAGSKMIVNMMANNQQNIETVKLFVYNQFIGLYDKLQKRWGTNSEYTLQDRLQVSNSSKIEEDDVKPGDQSLIRGSLHQNAPSAKNTMQSSLQNLNQINLIEMNQQSVTNSYQLQWVNQLNCGFVTMPLGTDNMHIPLNDSNIGSIISFVLGSNIYKEAMIKQNYMDIGSKIKAPNKHIRHVDPSASQDNLRASILGAGNNPSFLGQASSQYADETVKLFGKEDVFNYDLSPHQIETELLCGERLYFQIKFSTDKKDLRLRMVKNGTVIKLGQTSMHFVTGKTEKVKVKRSERQGNDSKLRRKEEIVKGDLHEKVCPQLSKDYMDKNNEFFMEQMGTLDSIVRLLNQAYINPNAQGFLKNSSPMRNPLTGADENMDYQLVTEAMPSTPIVDNSMNNANSTPNVRESMIQNMKSPQMGTSTPNIGGGATVMSPQLQNFSSDPQEFCNIRSPMVSMMNPFETLKNELQIQKVDYELKVFFPKKFEALRRFYCGSQNDFIESLIQTQEWTTVSGGKTKSKFHRSFDDKYVLKEIKKSEFKMFIEFAPQYFDYLCKSFFHNYPCALCKILGAYKIKITTYKNGQSKVTKKYIYISENLNFGIRPEDEQHIIRYDLKGSTLNRFVKKQMGANDQSRVVLHDNNFQLAFMGRPLPIRYTINRILHICINNDTLCLSKSNIVDYSLLTIIDTKRKKVRFGIIDYVQQYTLDKIFEGQFKRIINRGEVPTIVDPDKYKLRFKRAMKRYFIGMVVQEEKGIDLLNQQDQLEQTLQQQMIADDHDSEEDENGELNETLNKTIGLNETVIGKPTSHNNGDTDHENVMGNTGSERENHSNHVPASPAFQ